MLTDPTQISPLPNIPVGSTSTQQTYCYQHIYCCLSSLHDTPDYNSGSAEKYQGDILVHVVLLFTSAITSSRR